MANTASNRESFMEALADYIDARIQYEKADPEWRVTPLSEAEALETALDKLLASPEAN